MKKRFSVLLAALILLLSLAAPVSALPDPQRTGSLTFWMSFNGQPLEGGSLTLYRVGVVSVTDGDAGFLPVDALADGPQWTDLSDPKLAKELADLANQLDKAGSHMAFEQVMAAVSDFEKGNMRLRMVLASLNEK